MASSRRDTLLAVGLVIVAMVLLGPLLMGGLMALFWGGGGWHMGSGAMGVPGGFEVAMLLFALLPPLLIVLLLVWALRRVAGGGEDRVLEELRMALARGDISEEEYERRRDLLDEDRRE
jgi:putative membrane protein